MNQNRINIIKNKSIQSGPVVYWMSRDQRIEDNWALIFAIEIAKEKNQPVVILFNLVTSFLNATYRHYHFMLNGLKEVQIKANEYNIPFTLLKGNPIINIPNYLEEIGASALITDFDPLKIKRYWKTKIAEKINISMIEVDAHNIVPITYASDKLEFAAYTYRPKITKMLPYFLEEFPCLDKQQKFIDVNSTIIEPNSILSELEIDKSVKEIQKITPGGTAAANELQNFIEKKLNKYNDLRNNPNFDYQSGLSPYLHFGQISAQRVALEISKLNVKDDNTQAFWEELIVRRELSDNYCYYCLDYDNIMGFPEWARKTIAEHIRDEREFIYSLEQFEKAQTHEDLWNGAQMELVRKGKMHGYMRMYWAKKIFEWSKDPAEAQKVAIYLNDKYSLDGRDPNGYTGIAWSVGGVHDRPWTERPIFGKIRYMNLNGAMRKFNVNQYIQNNLQSKLF